MSNAKLISSKNPYQSIKRSASLADIASSDPAIPYHVLIVIGHGMQYWVTCNDMLKSIIPRINIGLPFFRPICSPPQSYCMQGNISIDGPRYELLHFELT